MSSLLWNKEDFSKTLVISVFILFTLVLQCEASSCFPNPCKNGGTCHLPPGKPFSCSCVFGFYVDPCEIRSKCNYQPIVEGQKNTGNVDGANLTGLDTTLVDKCKNDCENLPGCRAIEVKNSTCSAYTIVPTSKPDIAPLTSEKGRLFAIRRCCKKVTKKSSSPSGAKQLRTDQRG